MVWRGDICELAEIEDWEEDEDLAGRQERLRDLKQSYDPDNRFHFFEPLKV
jgi:FAD/FMN-containing dehydrogenase